MTDFAGFLAWLGLIAGSAAGVTKAVDLVRNALDRDGTAPKFLWNVAALVGGIALALGWPQDVNLAVAGVELIPALADKAGELDNVAGQIISGVLIGGAAGFAHEVFDRISGGAERAHAEAAAARGAK